MGFVTKTWKDRISQYPNRRTIDDGNITKTVTVGRAEGTVTETGDAFNATNMNNLESRINDAIDNIQSDLDVMTENEAHAIWNNA